MPTDPNVIELSLDQKRHLAEVADRTGREWSEVLEDALQPLYTRNGGPPTSGKSASFYEAMKDVIGIVKDAPSDLSTNPKYMEGFGRDPEPSAH